jgi:type-F conjugative transfer system protein TrbI
MAQHERTIQDWLKREARRHWVTVGYVIAGIVLAGVLISWLWPQPPKTVRQVRMTQLVDQFVQRTARQELSDEQRQQLVQQFTRRLNRRVRQLAADHNWVIVPAEAVMAGAPDVTGKVKAGLAGQPASHGESGS